MIGIEIPPATLEAGARAIHDVWRKWASQGDDISEYRVWEDLEPEEREMQTAKARAACLAMIEAWPKMSSRWLPSMVADDYEAIILPLTEASDEQ